MHALQVLSTSTFQKLYTWTSPDRKDKEMDELNILALVVICIFPHYKVDMYLEIKKIRKENLEQYENNLELFFDSICYHKLHIDQKNPLAYIDDQFIREIFKQLKGEQLLPAFWLEFEHAKVKWLMNCKNYSSESLMNEASLYSLIVNPLADGRLKPTSINKSLLL